MNERYLKQILSNDAEISLADLILAQKSLRDLAAGYGEAGVDVPAWVTNKESLVTDEITRMVRADLLRKLENAESQLDALRTPTEKRAALAQEIEQIKGKLNK